MSLHIAVCGCSRKALGRNARNFMFRNLRNSLLSIENTGNRLQREIQHAKASSNSNGKTSKDTYDHIMEEDLPNTTETDINKTLTSKKKDTADKSVKEWDFFNITRPNVKKIEDSVTHDLFQPVQISAKRDTGGCDIGAELTGGKIDRHDLLKVLSEFYNQPKTQILAAEHGLDANLLRKSFDQFRRYCADTDPLPVELHIIISDILAGAGHVDDIFPYFLQHAKQVFPHLECIEDLKKISDLTEPAHWYPNARNLKRKIIYHAGPTNSGKTYHALKRFIEAKSGVYCGPLRMLAVEVFNKCNLTETPCDLVTGEDRRQANPDGPAEHVACTVEMTNTSKHYEVAIIDEIQMLRDQARGWAWTRALHGICADEVHVCGEGSALDIVQAMAELCGDTFEMRGYSRLTKLTLLDQALCSLHKVQPGDCIVCFSRNDIYDLACKLEALGHQCAVIYGGLPPGTKYNQAEKFNDPDDPCNVLVATDAIGMGLNLAIKRIIFYTVHMTVIKDGVKEKEPISTSQALQIAGRAGRYGTKYELGEVTTFNNADLPVLKQILSENVDPVEQVGLHPTADQIETFAYQLPKATLSNLIDIFMHLCKVDHQNYFMCNMRDFKYLADITEPIPLPLKDRYVFCCAPISIQETLICNMFLKFGRKYSTGQPLTYEWLMDMLCAPFKPPKTLSDLISLEQTFDVFDLYLWLGYRFPNMFPDMEYVREAQSELNDVIQDSVDAITALLKGQRKTVKKKPVTIASEKYGKSKQPSKVSSSVSAKNPTKLKLKNIKNKEMARPGQVISQDLTPKDHFENLDERATDNLSSTTCDSAEAMENTSEDKEKVHRVNVKREIGKSGLKTSSEFHRNFESDSEESEKHKPTLTFLKDSDGDADIQMEKKTQEVKLFKEKVTKSALTDSLKRALHYTEKSEHKENTENKEHKIRFRRGKLTEAVLQNKLLTEEMLNTLLEENKLSSTCESDEIKDIKCDQELPEETEDSESDKKPSAGNGKRPVTDTVPYGSPAKDFIRDRNATNKSFPRATISELQQGIATKKIAVPAEKKQDPVRDLRRFCKKIGITSQFDVLSSAPTFIVKVRAGTLVAATGKESSCKKDAVRSAAIEALKHIRRITNGTTPGAGAASNRPAQQAEERLGNPVVELKELTDKMQQLTYKVFRGYQPAIGFICIVKLGEIQQRGAGRSVKEAMRDASQRMLDLLRSLVEKKNGEGTLLKEEDEDIPTASGLVNNNNMPKQIPVIKNGAQQEALEDFKPDAEICTDASRKGFGAPFPPNDENTS